VQDRKRGEGGGEDSFVSQHRLPSFVCADIACALSNTCYRSIGPHEQESSRFRDQRTIFWSSSFSRETEKREGGADMHDTKVVLSRSYVPYVAICQNERGGGAKAMHSHGRRLKTERLNASIQPDIVLFRCPRIM
jgi:hypothetical protein